MCRSLVEKYKISIIPRLVIIGPDGEIITSRGRKDIQDKGLISFRGWYSSMMAAAKKADQQNQLLEQIETEEEAIAETESEKGAATWTVVLVVIGNQVPELTWQPQSGAWTDMTAI